MYLVDTHTHIFLEEFDADRQSLIERAQESGVRRFFLPNIDTESVERLHSVCDAYPDECFPMMGLHPTSVDEDYPNQLDIIFSQFEKRKYIAVGEIGIDLYWDKTYLKEQKQTFEEQLRWSIDFDLPVAIHTREAFPEVFNSISRVGKNRLRGVFHSFGGTKNELEKALEYKDFMLGINGVVTYKNAGFREYLPLAPIERILLETDAPYLSPVPYRGKRNEPAYILKVAEKIAEIYDLSLSVVAGKTTENAKRLFANSYTLY